MHRCLCLYRSYNAHSSPLLRERVQFPLGCKGMLVVFQADGMSCEWVTGPQLTSQLHGVSVLAQSCGAGRYNLEKFVFW